MNDKDGYQVPPLKKTMDSHDVYFKPERVCTKTVVESGLENAAVEVVVAEKDKKLTHCRRNPRSRDRGRVFQEHRTNNTHGQAADVDEFRGIHSSIGTHCYYWRWRSVTMGSYELRARRVSYDYEGRSGCIGVK
jgi:hypothetical protein